jgi:hypothetical protein
MLKRTHVPLTLGYDSIDVGSHGYISFDHNDQAPTLSGRFFKSAGTVPIEAMGRSENEWVEMLTGINVNGVTITPVRKGNMLEFEIDDSSTGKVSVFELETLQIVTSKGPYPIVCNVKEKASPHAHNVPGITGTVGWGATTPTHSLTPNSPVPPKTFSFQAVHFDHKEVTFAPVNIGPTPCTCKSFDLFNYGCKCGAFKKG